MILKRDYYMYNKKSNLILSLTKSLGKRFSLEIFGAHGMSKVPIRNLKLCQVC